MKSIPKHIEKFFELQQFDLEVQLDSPRGSNDSSKGCSPTFTKETLSTQDIPSHRNTNED